MNPLYFIPIIIGIVFIGGAFSIWLIHEDFETKLSELEQKGRVEEYQQLLEVQNTKSCEEMILLVTQYTHSFWNGTINELMIQSYKDRCVPKTLTNGSES